MADISLDAVPILGKILGGVIGGGVAVMGFFSKFQTRGGCRRAHNEHEKLKQARRETRDVKLSNIHDSVETNVAGNGKCHFFKPADLLQ